MTTLDAPRGTRLEGQRPDRPRRRRPGTPGRATVTGSRGRRDAGGAATEPAGEVASSKAPVTLSYHLIGGATLLLLAIGVVMVLSASSILSIRETGTPYSFFFNQAQYALIGLPLLVIASRIPVRWYRMLAWPAMLGALAMQALIFTPLGVGEGGNTNWIYIPGFGQTIQPSEFLKLALALWLGLVFARKLPLLRQAHHVLIPGLLGAGAALALVLGGHDVGTALIFVALTAGALFVAGVPLRWFAFAAVVAAGAVAYLVVDSDNRMQRITALFQECDSSVAACYQAQHGLYGLATGGVSGVGLGASREKWSYLPEAQNDFIFAIIGEELGLLGTLVVLALFGVLAVGFYRIILRHPDPFVKITTAAIATWILFQALVNIGVVVGVLPVIGVPLPLVSAGGSALIATLLAMGVVLAFARDEPGAAEALRARRGAVRRSLAVVANRGRRGR